MLTAFRSSTEMQRHLASELSRHVDNESHIAHALAY